MNTILFPTDFSKNSVHASKYAGMLAEQLNANVVLLHIYSVPMTTEYQLSYDVDGLMKINKEVAEESLRKFTAQFLQNTHLPPNSVSQKVDYGSVADTIISTAAALNASMIVMGTKGATDTLDRWLGTTAQGVMNSAQCPVWIVPAKASLERPRQVMYAADFKENEIAATQKILSIIDPLTATCRAVHINEYFEPNVGHKAEYMAADLNYVFENENIDFVSLNRDDIIVGLEAYIKTHKPDVLALAIYEKSFFGDLFSTSISKHFVQEANLPLLAFRK